MLKVSEIISKEVISIYESESLGTIKNIILNSNLTKVLKFVFFNDETDTESCVLSNNIYSLSEDGILVKNFGKVDFFAEQENNPINKKIFTLGANDFGKIKDITIDNQGNVLKFLSSKGKEFSPSNIIIFGEVCLINENNEKIKLSSFKPKSEFVKSNELIDNLQVKIIKMEEKQETKTMPTFPAKITPNVSNLIGKRVSKTITGLNNEIIIRQASTISKHTLEMAKIHNKTNELIYNAL